ncbi:TetR family transcriptional regulator [Leifsonia sp. McL0607]|uniref:TetR family transcriptional regulator n=1 Tax=Leifsonia sp. McL0607 TaxID=3415672 RepID=UPI003CF254C5
MMITTAAKAAVDGFRQETHLAARPPESPAFVVHALGRDFGVSDEMARIFLHQVEVVAESDSSALVVLRHTDGVELIMVTDSTSFSIRAATPADQAVPAAPYPRMRG